MKVDYGEIIFQSSEGITEDQGMVQFFVNLLAQGLCKIFTRIRAPQDIDVLAVLDLWHPRSHLFRYCGRPSFHPWTMVFVLGEPTSEIEIRSLSTGTSNLKIQDGEDGWVREFEPEKVEIDFKVEYNRDTSNSKIEELLEEKWKLKTAENSRLYSQSKFRLHSLHRNGSNLPSEYFSKERVRETLDSLDKARTASCGWMWGCHPTKISMAQILTMKFSK